MGIYIRNARYLLTVDGQRRIIRDGAIAIEGTNIVEVGKTDELNPKYGGAEHVIDASNSVVTPGLVDCHLHTAMSLARGIADNVFLPTWIHERLYPFEAALTPEEVHVSAQVGLIEAIKTGTTFIADPGSYHMDGVVKAVEETGMRAVLARALADISTPGRPIPEAVRQGTKDALQAGEAFVKSFNGAAQGRVKAWFSLRTERTFTNELASAVKEKADQYQTGIESHVSNTQDSVNRHKEIFRGKTPLRRYLEAGILGPNLLIIHANWLTTEEIELVKKHDVKVVHCPSSSFADAGGTLVGGRFEEMEEAGVTVALGCDNAAASNFLDMVRVGYAMTAHRDVKLDATLYPPETILEMLTLQGAKALLSDREIGSIEVGKKADLVLWDLTMPGWTPLLNPVSNLINSASGDSAQTVIINGDIVMRDYKIQHLDETTVREKGQKISEEVADRSGTRIHASSVWPLS